MRDSVQTKLVRQILCLAFLVVLLCSVIYDLFLDDDSFWKLKTVQAEKLTVDLYENFSSISDIKIEYMSLVGLRIICIAEELSNETLNGIMDIISTHVSSKDFIESYERAYKGRFGYDISDMVSEGIRSDAIMVYFCLSNQNTPEHKYSSSYPFNQWYLVK